jgi:hypothetical protein
MVSSSHTAVHSDPDAYGSSVTIELASHNNDKEILELRTPIKLIHSDSNEKKSGAPTAVRGGATFNNRQSIAHTGEFRWASTKIPDSIFFCIAAPPTQEQQGLKLPKKAGTTALAKFWFDNAGFWRPKLFDGERSVCSKENHVFDHKFVGCHHPRQGTHCTLFMLLGTQTCISCLGPIQA